MERFRLEDIDKKEQLYKVPDGYFEDLPMKIQARIESSTREKVSWFQTPAFRVALSSAAVLIVVVSYLFINNGNNAVVNGDAVEEILSQVSQEELLMYVNELQLGEDEILTALENSFEEFDFSSEMDLDDLELEDEALEDVLDEFDLTEEYLEI